MLSESNMYNLVNIFWLKKLHGNKKFTSNFFTTTVSIWIAWNVEELVWVHLLERFRAPYHGRMVVEGTLTDTWDLWRWGPKCTMPELVARLSTCRPNLSPAGPHPASGRLVAATSAEPMLMLRCPLSFFFFWKQKKSQMPTFVLSLFGSELDAFSDRSTLGKLPRVPLRLYGGCVPSSTGTVLSHIDQLFLGGYLWSLALCSRWAHPCFFRPKFEAFWGNIPKFWNLSLFWGEDVCSVLSSFFEFFMKCLSRAESCLLKEISSVVVCFEKMGHCVVAPQNECSCLELVLV